MRLAFSTLGCPDWTVEQVGDAVSRDGYDGVELRLVDGELLTDQPSAAMRERLLALARRVQVAAVDTSLRLAELPPDWEQELERWCELAAALGCGVLRLFGGTPLEGLEKAQGRLQEDLARAGAIAARHQVVAALETHDAFSSAHAVRAVFGAQAPAGTGVIWDVHHPYRMGEAPHEVWDAIGAYVVHVHVKDARRDASQSSGWQLVLLGEGEVPVREPLDFLQEAGYAGWVSVEWEKKWHPELADPEIALPQHAALLRQWLR